MYALIFALAGSWSPISATYAASQGDPAADQQRRRAALSEVVRRALVR